MGDLHIEETADDGVGRSSQVLKELRGCRWIIQ